MQKIKKVTFDYPADKYHRLKVICAKKQISIKEYITQAIAEMLLKDKSE